MSGPPRMPLTRPQAAVLEAAADGHLDTTGQPVADRYRRRP